MPRVCRSCGREVADAAYCPYCSEATTEDVAGQLVQSDALTIRKLFNRKKLWITTVGYSSLAIGIATVILEKVNLLKTYADYVSPSLLAICVITMFYGYLFAFHCPRCGNNWSMIAMPRSTFTIDPRIQMCPFCGTDVDKAMCAESQESSEFLKEKWGQKRALEIKNTNIQPALGNQKGNTDIQPPPGKEDGGRA